MSIDNIKAQEESHSKMKNLAESIRTLPSQLDRLKDIPKSSELYVAIVEFPGMMKEVVDFIEKWLESWSGVYLVMWDGLTTESLIAAKHILVPYETEAIELRKKVDGFRDQLVADLAIEIRVAQQLDDLVRAIGGNRLPLRKPCMEGTRQAVLQEIEDKVKSIDSHNVIWIRGSPGVGKSALAASISTRLQDKDQHVISFRFDHVQSTTITTDSLWCVVACDLVRQYPSLHQHLVEGSKGHSSSDIDRLFKSLIETPLSTLDDVPHEELPVIVIDALDKCGGLRHDSSGWDDYEGLLRTLKRWIQVDHLRKFKLVITSRPDNRITQIFPDSISTHVNIPSGGDVKPGDSASDDIRVFLRSQLDAMGMEEA